MQLGFIHQGDLGSRVIGRRDQHIFFVRAQIINNLGFVSWMCSLAAIHPWCYFRRAARDQCEHGPASAPIKLYLRALKLGFHRMITSETFFLKMRFVQPIENVRVFLVQGPSKPVYLFIFLLVCINRDFLIYIHVNIRGCPICLRYKADLLPDTKMVNMYSYHFGVVANFT